MAFMRDTQVLKPGLVIFRRADVAHDNWYCRIRLPDADKYKTVRLGTAHIDEAMDKAFDIDAETRFRIKHEMPVFDRKFSDVAAEYSAHEKARSEAGEITRHRWRVLESHVKTQLNRYVGNDQVTLVTEERWKKYPTWRRNNGKGRSGGLVSEATIRSEMTTFRSIMRFAAMRSYIRDSQVIKGALPLSKVQRDEFTPEEYRALYTYGRKWIKQAKTKVSKWYRTVIYNFILIMTNTGMRPAEAKNLRWRDVALGKDREGREFARISVRGKDKFRTLVAPESAAKYLERIRAISKSAKPEDFVFTNHAGKPARTLYYGTIETLLIDAGLLRSSAGKRRSTYCFRHTYATFRLSEGVEVYFLAKQMGTSVQMIEDHYGHVTPVKNADKILTGLPGWEPISPRLAK